MAGNTEGLHLDYWGVVILGDMGDGQRVLPAKIKLARTPAKLITLRAAPAASFLDFVCYFMPIIRI